MVPAASAGVMLVAPAPLMLIILFEGSTAKLFGAVIAELFVVHVEVSSSAPNNFIKGAADRLRELLREKPEVEGQAVGQGRDVQIDAENRHVPIRVAADVVT